MIKFISIRRNIITIFLLFLFSFGSFSQVDTINDLLKHSIAFESFKAENYKLPVKTIYMFGEYHSYYKSNDIAHAIFDKISNKGSTKLYLMESSRSTEYFLEKYLKTNSSKVHYNQGSFDLFAYKKLKSTFKFIKENYRSDTSVVFKSFDIEDNFDFALMALYDLLISSNNSSFTSEISKIKKSQGVTKYSNEKNYEISRWVISQFYSDTSKYQKNLKDDYGHYSEIIASLEQGIVVDSLMTKIPSNFSQTMAKREFFLKLNIHKIVLESRSGAVFIHSGLVHILDTGNYYGNESYQTVAEYLRQTFGRENVCRVGIILLKEHNDYYNQQIFNAGIIKKYSKAQKKKTSLIDLRYIQYLTRSKVDFAVFCK